ncbi:MAG: serine hydrolase [Geminicoccaceae bacterium]
MAADQTDEQILEAIWLSPGESASQFSDLFLDQIPPDKIVSLLADFVQRCGAMVIVRKAEGAGEFSMVTERCEIPTVIARNTDGKIDRLSLYQPVWRNAALDDLLGEIASFEGSVSYAVFVGDGANGELIAGHDADRPMAVGSAFKLIVLAAILGVIEEGEADWSDVVKLEKKHISLPSGRLQNMPIGSPFTLHTLAAAMIADSDNTATDVLIDVLGRDRLEALSGLKPFLTTREFFQLKAGKKVYERYEKADLSGRYAILDTLGDAPLPSPHEVLTPWQPEAEWLLSTEALCNWITKVADLDLMQLNPGMLRQSGWQRIAYKGGSETGVLNYTTLARDARDRDYCVAITWNADRSIDPEPLGSLYVSVFQALARRP